MLGRGGSLQTLGERLPSNARAQSLLVDGQRQG